VSDLEVLRTLLRQRSLTFGDFVLSSGQHSSYYIDARRTTMSARGLDVIGRLGLAAIRAQGWGPVAVGGLTMGADPVAYAVARASVDDPPIVDAFSVRKGAKDHGTRRLVEGTFEPGARVVVIEDVITSGGSALQAIASIEREGGEVLGVLAVVDRLQGGRAAIEATGISVVCLTATNEIGVTPS
jgi:orotate phosphoribosyltransferase